VAGSSDSGFTGAESAENPRPENPSTPMASGQFAAPRRRPAPPAQNRPRTEPVTEEFPAIRDGVEATSLVNPAVLQPNSFQANPAQPNTAVGSGPAAGQPDTPAGLADWRQRRLSEQLEDTEVGVLPTVSAGDSSVALDPAGVNYDDLPPTGYHENLAEDLRDELHENGSYADEDPEVYEDPELYEDSEEYESDAIGELPEDELEDKAAGLGDDSDGFSSEAAERSPAKQWAVLGGQLAAGVVAGAVAWLGFDWLWMKIPAAALICALGVIGALVWIIRKIRRADDMQTTVLAVLVGLIATVSPAALLLLSK
jgi:hypothetical protein